MRKLFIAFMTMACMSLLFFFSCQKENEIDPKLTVKHLPLKIGNYWIYQQYEVDTFGNETNTKYIDSVIINNETIINGNQYYIFESNIGNGNYRTLDTLRDSCGYIVNLKGFVLFAENNFTDTIARREVIDTYHADTLLIVTYQMEKTSNTITVPAGTFRVLNYKGTAVTSLITPGIKWPRYTNCYYAEGVGKIMETYHYVLSPMTIEKKLIRYNILD
jgi:hypothetical protein